MNSNSCELLCFICVLSLSVNLLSFLSSICKSRIHKCLFEVNVAASHDDAPMIRTQFGPPLPSFHSLQSSGGMIFNGVTVGAPSSSPICTWRQRHVFLPGVFPYLVSSTRRLPDRQPSVDTRWQWFLWALSV